MSHLMTIVLLLQLTSKYSTSLKISIIEKLRKTGYVDGKYIIGALLPIHGSPFGSSYRNPLECERLADAVGVQLVEAALYAIDAINRDETILPGTKLGINIKDECWNDLIALYQTIKLIEVPISSRKDTTTKSQRSCSRSNSSLIGIIGTATSASTTQVQNLLKLFRIPQIGYSAPSLDLYYPHFYLSVIPSHYHEAYLIINILRKFKWNYISVAFTEDYFGINSKFYLQEWVRYFSICIAVSVHIPRPEYEKMYSYAMAELFKDKRAKVIVCFCDGATITNLYREFRQQNLTGNFIIIGSNDWPTSYSTVDGYEEQAQGSIMIGIKRKYVPEFDRYFLTRNVTNNTRNPWFQEYWEHRFDCTFQTDNPNVSKCTGNEDPSYNYHQGLKAYYVIKSVYTLAYGLHEMLTNSCNNSDQCLNSNPFNSTEYMQYLSNLSFSFHDENVNFGLNGSSTLGSYDVFNFQKLKNGSYDYVQFSDYFFDFNNDEHLNEDTYQRTFKYFDDLQLPVGKSNFVSVCSDPCQPGQIQVEEGTNGFTDKVCCWTCITCNPEEIVYNTTTCQSCPKGLTPDDNKTNCIEIPIKYLQWTSYQFYTAKGLSIVGIISTLFTAYVFVKYRNTPVVKSSTRELCYVILVGLLMHHSTTFITVAKPSILSCGFIRVFPSISATVVYASLLVKTNRIARLLAISKRKFPNLNPKFMTLKAQIVLTTLLIALQIILCSTSFIFWPSTLTQNQSNGTSSIVIYIECDIPAEANVASLVYNAVLIVSCTYYAFKTRNIPDNFNEAKFIGFLMYVSCLTSMACCIIYYGSDHKMLSIGIGMSVNGFGALFFLFFPKLYIILWAPERNTRKYFATATGIRCIIGRTDIISNKKLLRKKFLKNDLKNLEELPSLQFSSSVGKSEDK